MIQMFPVIRKEFLAEASSDQISWISPSFSWNPGVFKGVMWSHRNTGMRIRHVGPPIGALPA